MRKVNVGIDLGTTYSAVATFNKDTGRVEVFKNSLESETTPSVVMISGKNVVIGQEAKDEQKGGNTSTAAFYKSMMGNPDYKAYLDGKDYSAEDLSALFLRELKKDIEETNDVSITGAVITVPAYFDDKQREATLRAGKTAGFNVLKIINEPTAAIIAYGLTGGKEKNVLVYDLGGGTFDVTIAHVSGTSVDVLATNGNHQLGGRDWDQAIIDIVLERFYDEYGFSIMDHPEDMKELQVKCEDAKRRLTTMQSTQISISSEGVTGKYEVTREEFEDRTSNYLNETMLLIGACFTEISEATKKPFGWSNIDEVVLVGGSTRMPQVKDAVVREYGRSPVTKDINVDTIVASGAAMQAELCVSSKITLTVAGKVDEKTGQKTGPTLLTINNSQIQDITSHGLGMLALAEGTTEDYINSIIIMKNSKINTKFAKEYQFAGTELEVYVLQGESRDPYDTSLLGKYTITGMPKASRKEPNIIIVDFLYNSNGVVEVEAHLKDGTPLTVTKEVLNETIGQVIARLKEQKGKRVARDVEVMLAIDVSGSMSGRPMEMAKKAAKEFAKSFDYSYVKMTVISFADKSHIHCRNCDDLGKINRAIDEMECNCFNVGYCNAECPITSNHHLFSKDAVKVCVVLTDGYWERPNVEENTCNKLKKDEDYLIYGIGIGGADEAFLKRISSNGGKLVDLSKLAETFVEVADSIATEVGG